MYQVKRKGIMLAHPVNQRKLSFLPEKVLFQPKLRGERCRIEFVEEKYSTLISSYCNPFYFLERIQMELDELNQFLRDVHDISLNFDGELYKHGWTQEEINSAANRTKNKSQKSKELKYHIFDFIDFTCPQNERAYIVNTVIKDAIDYLNLFSVKTVPFYLSEKGNYLDYTKLFTDEGYEGLIIRNPLGFYQTKRTNDLLKYKPNEEDYYKILSIQEAIDKHGNKKGMIGSFIVSSDPGTSFKVGAGKLTHAERIFYFKNRNILPGRLLKVKHESIKTVNKVPLCCVALSVKGLELEN